MYIYLYIEKSYIGKNKVTIFCFVHPQQSGPGWFSVEIPVRKDIGGIEIIVGTNLKKDESIYIDVMTSDWSFVPCIVLNGPLSKILR